MTQNEAIIKLRNNLKYNNGKIATTQLEQIMVSFIDPAQRNSWRWRIKLSLQCGSYADPIFALRKIDNSYHQILSVNDMTTHKTIWKLS